MTLPDPEPTRADSGLNGGPADAPASDQSFSSKALRTLGKLMNRKPPSARAQRWLFFFAFALFVGISIISFRSLEADDLNPWIFAVLVLGTTPLTMFANAAEYQAMGRIGDHDIGTKDALTLTILAAAANLLPVPGGLVVRTEALRRKGSSLKRAVAANAAAGLTWIAVGSAAVGTLLVITGERLLIGSAMVLTAAALLVVVWKLLRRATARRAPKIMVRLLLVESGLVLVNSIRLWLAFRMLGFEANPAQAVALTAPVIIAAAVGIFPSGLGLREALAGGFGLAVDMPAARAVAATAADRVAAQVGLALIAGALWVSRSIDGRRPAPSSEELSSLSEGLPEATHGPFDHPTDLP